jgi:hypothetical protein
MKSCSKGEIRRCRPLLGTFVEITARGKGIVDLERAIDAAFAAVAEVHQLMSFHDPQSDVSRMNRDAFPKGVTVHPWTWEVMNAARNLARESSGAFDVTVAPLLAGRNCLADSSCAAVRAASWRDIFPRRNFEVFFRRRVIVDLGGIAKGFAVDRAVDVLKQKGAASGIVNAGGDIRVFGSTSHKVHLRDPKSPVQFSAILSVRNRRDRYFGHLFRAGRIDRRTNAPQPDEFHQRHGGGARLHDRRCADEGCVRLARESCGLAGAISCGRIVARAQWCAILDVSLIMRHSRPDSIQLRHLQRYFLYAVVALLFLSGVAWTYWNYLAASPGDFETSAKTWAMKIHGAAAMAILVLIGMLLSNHVRFAWRAGRNRANGSVFLSAFAVLTITGYGLYYAGGERTACVDELDTSRCRPGFADLAACSHLSGKEDTPFGSISEPIASCVS